MDTQTEQTMQIKRSDYEIVHLRFMQEYGRQPRDGAELLKFYLAQVPKNKNYPTDSVQCNACGGKAAKSAMTKGGYRRRIILTEEGVRTKTATNLSAQTAYQFIAPENVLVPIMLLAYALLPSRIIAYHKKKKYMTYDAIRSFTNTKR